MSSLLPEPDADAPLEPLGTYTLDESCALMSGEIIIPLHDWQIGVKNKQPHLFRIGLDTLVLEYGPDAIARDTDYRERQCLEHERFLTRMESALNDVQHYAYRFTNQASQFEEMQEWMLPFERIAIKTGLLFSALAQCTTPRTFLRGLLERDAGSTRSAKTLEGLFQWGAQEVQQYDETLFERARKLQYLCSEFARAESRALRANVQLYRALYPNDSYPDMYASLLSHHAS